MTNVLLTGSLESFIQLLGALFIFAVVLAATYLTTRWMGGMQRGRQNNKNLHVIETISVGNNKMISIVEAGRDYSLLLMYPQEKFLPFHCRPASNQTVCKGHPANLLFSI